MIKKIIFSIIFFGFCQNMIMAHDQNLGTAYLLIMQEKIELNWIRPLQKTNKSVIVQFTMSNLGQVMDAEVIKSSNDDLYDRGALLAVYKSVPFKELSGDLYSSDTETFQVFFSDDYVTVSKIDNAAVIPNASLPVGADYVSYMRNLEFRVQSNWNQEDYPKNEAVITAFTINKDGSVQHLHILRSSGSDKFDDEALDAIRKSNPVDSLPDYVSDDSIQVQFGFFYNPLRNTDSIQNSTSCGFLDANSNLVSVYENYKKEVSTILQANLTTKACYKITEIILDITIDKYGQISCINIEKPSSDKNFDKNVVSSISRSSFPAIPLEFNRSSFSFKYSVKTKNNDNLGQAFVDGTWFGAKQYVPCVIWD